MAKFEAFSSGRPLTGYADESERKGIRRLMVSWEPWHAGAERARRRRAVAARSPAIATSTSRAARRIATSPASRASSRDFPGTVYLRYAHEMNGYWYPWSNDPRAYRWAWRRIVRLFAVAGADNVRFVWSVNANLYEPVARVAHDAAPLLARAAGTSTSSGRR